MRVLADCANGIEALRAAGELSPDVVFLDIEMPKLSGFEVLELLDPKIAAVFVTAYDEWAVKAFEVHAVDYVLKPFEPARIAAAVERARERLRLARAPRDAGALAAAARPAGTWLERVVVRDGARVHIIPVEKLLAARAQDDYVELSSEGKTYLKAQTLGEPRGRRSIRSASCACTAPTSCAWTRSRGSRPMRRAATSRSWPTDRASRSAARATPG